MNEEGLKVLPESIHDWNEVKESDTPEKFWDQMTNLRSKIGTGLYQPGKDAGNEDWDKFTNKAIDLSNGKLMPMPNLEDEEQRNILYKTLGKPNEAKDYEFEKIEGVDDLPDERREFIANAAFNLNLTKSQLKALDKVVRTADGEANNQLREKFTGEIRDLKQEWGMASDDRMHQAIKVAKVFFPQLGDSPTLSAAEIKSFYSLSKQLGGKSTEFADQNDSGNNQLSPDDATVKISEVMNNKDHPYHKVSDPGHQVAVKLMRNLYLAKNNKPTE